MRSARRYSGFSLMEAVVVFFILGLLSAGALALFIYGSRAFHHSITRQGLLGESERIRIKLTGDFKPSHHATVAVAVRQTTLADGTDVQRDGVAFATLSDWKDSSNFTVQGLPRWNRYVVYYATTEASGRMVRQLVEPGGNFPPRPYAALGTNLSLDPTNNLNVLQTTVLSKNVLSFEVERNEERQLLDINLKLRDGGRFEANSTRKVDEVQESIFSLEALNTYPRL